MMDRVCIESPLRGDHARNILYAEACMLDSLSRGEAPFLGHLMFPRVLDDTIEAHRTMGITAHLTWLRAANIVAVYRDLGITEGMAAAVKLASTLVIRVTYRELGDQWPQHLAARTSRTPGF